ncbi:hypothetical protein [Thalassoroseus pseudoceratinae]|uniref:hypothetical protein n=1 Tax=Thalassoroseus pseudoceratinae TaxID=2713176 RepID=UPI001422D3EB|nr:hypothetical protein [Thalassoroseus pseudoceratinae]
MKTINIAATTDFLEEIYGELPGNGYLLSVCTPSSNFIPATFTNIPDTVEFINRTGADEDIYFRITTLERIPAKGKRGDSSLSSALPGLYADIDTALTHGPNHPADASEALQILEALPLAPTLVVGSSGENGGLHAYWLFHEPTMLETPEDRICAERLLEGWNDLIKAEFVKRGYKYERLKDLARIFRPPGTYHQKSGGEEVRILRDDRDRRYEPSDFEEFEPEEVAKSQVNVDHIELEDNPEASAKLELLLKQPKFAAVWNRETEIGDGSQSAYDWHLAHVAYRNSFTDSETAWLVSEHRRIHDEEPLKAQRPDYIKLTLAKAKSNVAEQKERQIVLSHQEHKVNDKAVELLAKDSSIYQRAGQLVTVTTAVEPNGTVAVPQIAPLSIASVRECLSRQCDFMTIVKNQDGSQELRPAHPPQWCSQAIRDRGQYPQSVRPLRAIVEHAILKPDGSILTQPGYDAATGLYLHDGAIRVSVPSNPTRAQALAARDMLSELTTDFPFATDAHRAAWFAFLLTVLARMAYDGPSPLFLIDANTPGVGKSLLAELVSIICYGRSAARMSNPKDNEECRKQITTAAMWCTMFVLLDNISGKLGCASLDAALTSTIWQDRVLGRNEQIKLPLYMTWCASGNNVALEADTSRRTAHIRLQANCEKPEERQGFKHPDIRRYARENRGRLLSAALTILRAYQVAGKPDMKLPPWGSFEGWSETVRNAVVWVGLTDPGKTRQELSESVDTEVMALRELLEAWSEAKHHIPADGVRLAELLRKLDPSFWEPKFKLPVDLERLHDAICEFAPGKSGGLPTPRVLGYRLRGVRRRIVNGCCLDCETDRQKTAVWRLVETQENVHPQSPAEPQKTQVMKGIEGDENPHNTQGIRRDNGIHISNGAKHPLQSPASPAAEAVRWER